MTGTRATRSSADARPRASLGLGTRALTRYRELRMIGRGLLSEEHVILAHIIPIRRCNLACRYCNEFDDFSRPVPTDVMLRRIDKLAELRTSIVTISGGEPLLHPELERVIERIRQHGAIAGLITNGYLLTPERIRSLNAAGLEHLQISIDNVNPDDVSKKSLKVLDKKLRYLAEHADFRVNINSVIGGGIETPEDARAVAERAVSYGFASSVGIIHDDSGALKPLSERERELYDEVRALGRAGHVRFDHFQERLARGLPNTWRCRAGARYLYVCEEGRVHYCSQQRGHPGTPLEDYTWEDYRREYDTQKACAPTCTVGCVLKVGAFDNWRNPQTRQPANGRSGQPELQTV